MKKILIFGGAGSLGTELINYYIDSYQIFIASRDEAKHWEIKSKLKNKKINSLICDVRDSDRVYQVLLEVKPDIIIIAHALKQVDVCEIFPEESVKTNILGIINIEKNLKKLIGNNSFIPEKICFISTDKSCNPINVYGMCKSISEKIMLNFADYLRDSKVKTKILVVRYGNVLSSKGSIIPLLLKQVKEDSNFTLTHEDMTRFIMTLSEAVALIDTALNFGHNGEMWVPKLPSMKIKDLMQIFCEKFNKSYDIVGIRPGEKIHEVMLSLEEMMRADTYLNYFIITNKITSNFGKEYSSSSFVLPYEDLKEYILKFLKDNYDI